MSALRVAMSDHGTAMSALQSFSIADNLLCGLNNYGAGLYDSRGMRELLRILSTNRSVSELDISQNVILPEGCEMLAEELKDCPEMVRLDMSKCSIGSPGSRHLAELLSTTSIRYGLALNAGGRQQ